MCALSRIAGNRGKSWEKQGKMGFGSSQIEASNLLL